MQPQELVRRDDARAFPENLFQIVGNRYAADAPRFHRQQVHSDHRALEFARDAVFGFTDAYLPDPVKGAGSARAPCLSHDSIDILFQTSKMAGNQI